MDDLEGAGAVQRIYLAIWEDVDRGRLVPGQRLVEADLTERFGVGRNAVREAMQRLEGRGIVDLNRHRSATIRSLSIAEALDILDVAEAMIVLLSRRAATNLRDDDRAAVVTFIAKLAGFEHDGDGSGIAHVRREFYRMMFGIARSRELERLVPTIATHILYAQYRSRELYRIRLEDYRAILEAVFTRSGDAAETVARRHVERVRRIIGVEGQEHPPMP